MFVRKTILLDKHNGVLGNSIQLKKKNNKIFLTSSATNKYPVRYNNANTNIGHFNYITETPSAYVYDLNEDISKGFVKHDYSELHDQDSLEGVEMAAAKDGIVVLNDSDSISKTTSLTLNKKYYCANDYVVEVKSIGSAKGLYIYKLINSQLTQIDYKETIESSITRPFYIINDSIDSKFLTILARDSSGIITANELNKETDSMQVYRFGGFREPHNYGHIAVNVNECTILTVLEYTPEVSLSFLGEYAGVFRSFTFDLQVNESINYATSFTNINYGPEAVNGLDATNYWKNDLLVFPSKNGLGNVALICNNLNSIYIRLMQIDLNAEMIPSNNSWKFAADSSKFINVFLKVQAINSKIFANVRNVKDDIYQIELMSNMAISTFQLNINVFDNLIKIFEEPGENRNKWNFNTTPELLLDVDINSEQRLTPNTQFIIDENSSICNYYKNDTPLIETNKLYKSLIKYDNPLLNRSFEDELFNQNLANTDYIYLPPYAVSDGIIALKGDYSLPNWYLGIPGMFLCGNVLDGHSRSISELRVYGDASVVGTLNGQHSTNKAQTLYFKQDIVNNSGQVISKDTNLSFDISYEAYGDSKIFEIESKVIDLSNIVNMSKCTFTQKGNVLTDINSEQMFAFDFWSVESSVAPASTLYFELDVKVYKNMTKPYDYINADYDIITLKAVNYKPSGRYFAFSISVDANELFVESYAGTHTYNVFPAIWSGNSHPTPSTFPTEANRQHLLIPREIKHSKNVFRYVTNNYSILPKTAIKNPDEYITLIKATEQAKNYEIMYVNIIPIDDFTTQIKFKVKLNKGLKLKTKIAIIVNPNDLFIEFNDSKYSQLTFDVEELSIFEFKISSKQLPINNEMISNISYKIQDIDSSIQYINIKDI